MIWRLTYCNKEGVEARIDIIRGNRTPVEIVQGSGQPFTLAYKLDKNDKSGHIMTSSADIEIFETETFNIDDLKTSNETELKVEYFEDNALTWEGFILPDFFSREIGSPNIVRMTASDRLTALKGVTLSGLPTKVSLRDLIELSLAQTGLNLGLVSQVQINQGSTNILDSEVLSQRLTDVRGRSINCHDILMSIMVGTNSTIRQRAGQWQVYNKLEHELRTPTIFFDKVERGAIRTIQPVASSGGVYNEFGGGRSYPDNYDFSDGLTGWTAVNGFVATIDNRKVDNFVSGTGVISQEWTTNPVYGDATEKSYIVNDNYGIDYDFADKPYLKSSDIAVTYPSESQINVNVLVNATGPFIDSTAYRGETNFAVIASNGTKTLHLAASGAFETLDGDPFLHKVTFDGDTHLQAVSSSRSVNGLLSVEEGNLNGYNITVRLYGYTKGVTGGRFLVTTLVDSVIVTFKNISDAPKGNLYKTTQGSNFTKQHDIETTVFGDYITRGLNGYFYNYPIDDTSNLYLPSGILSSPIWKTVFDTTERPLLHHVSRQKSRLFSVAHDILRANINVESFDPLAVFQDCKGGKYVVVSASFDFLRSEVDVELEQIAYDNTILKRDFIYSYFGDGEDTIKSIGGIAGGGGTGGGGGSGMTNDQVAILNDVAKLAHLHENKEIIDQITQDMVDNASHEIVISTDTETELTDENILSSLRVLSEIAKNNETFLEDLKERFLSKIEPDTAQKLIKFVEGIEIGDYTTGALGGGAAVKMIDGTSFAEVDNLTVRQKATFRELIIESLKHIGGQLVLTPARMKCIRVVEEDTFYKCYFDTGDGEVTNEFVAGDLARCQVFTGSGTKFYWRLVTLVGDDWINLSKTTAAVGSDVPEAGDDITQLGNATDTERQSAIILSTVGIDAPSWKQYSGINSFSLEGKETTVFSKLGNRISGETVFTSGGANLETHLDGVAQDILDALRAAQDAEDKAQQAIEDAEADVAIINTEIGRLQDQIDGKVSNWYYAYTPTLSNYPASDWTTNEIKDAHIGDTFTNTEPAPAENAGKSWRFIKDGSTYSWIVISDSDALKALQEASKAQATADGKSTTYLFQPTKYKLGDMWVLNDEHTINGTVYKQGELLTATQDSETFNEAHWLKRVRYTDDTAINELEIGGRNLILNSDDLNRNSSDSGVSSEKVSDGKYDNVLKITNPNLARYFTLDRSIYSEYPEPNRDFTVSFLVRGVTGEGKPSYLQLYYNSESAYQRIECPISEEEYRWVSITYNLIDNVPRNHVGISNFTELYFAKMKVEKGNKATDWTPAPEDVQASIETAKTEAENAANEYADTKAEAERVLAEAYADGIVSDEEQARIDDVNDKLAAAKAYAEAQDVLLKTQQEAYADGKISAAEQAAIQAAKDYADLKKTEAQAYADGIVSDEEARAIADALEKYNESKAHAEQLVKDIEIGGRNLIIRSTEEVDASIGSLGNITSTDYHSATDYIKVEPNRTYSFSKIPSVLVSEGIGGVWRYDWHDEDKVFISRTAEIHRHNFQWVIPNNAHYVRISYPTDSQPKFEKGNKVTDWTPAPEDVQASIETAKTEAENAAQAYADIKAEAERVLAEAYADDIVTAEEQARIDDVNDKLAAAKAYAEAQDVLLKTQQEAYADGKISTAEQAAIQAARDYADLKKTEAQAYADGIVSDEEARAIADALEKYNASKAHAETLVDNLVIGGRNLLTGTSADFTERIMSDTSAYSQWFYPNAELEVGETYTFTLLVEKVSQDNVPINVHIGVGETSYQRDIVAWRNNDIPFGQRVSLTHTVQPSDLTATHTKFAFRLRNNRLPTVIRFKDIKLEKGNKASDWTPAPEDTYRELGYMEARYIRSYLKGSNINNNNTWVQIQALNKSGVNVALGKTVTASTTGTNLDRITNGVTDYNDTATVSNTGQVEWVQVDLGKVYYDIDSIIHHNYWYSTPPTLADRVFNDTKIEVSTDGITWKTIFDSAVSGTYVETKEGKVHTTKLTDRVDKATQEAEDAAAKAQALDYLKQAIGQDGKIQGALYTLVTILLKANMNADVTAGISGIQGVAKNLPAFWAGGTDQQAQQGTAKAIIRHNGTVKFTDAEITGVINALTGEIGNFNIQDGKLKSSYSKSKAIWDYSKFPAEYVGESNVNGEVTVSVDAVELKEVYTYQAIPNTKITRITPDGVSVKSTNGVNIETKSELVDGRLSIEVSNSLTGYTSKVEIFSDGIYFDGQKFTGGGGGGSDYTHPSTHSASMITAGTLQGIVKANNNTSYTTKQVRNMILSTGDAVSSQMANGDIWIKYE